MFSYEEFRRNTFGTEFGSILTAAEGHPLLTRPILAAGDVNACLPNSGKTDKTSSSTTCWSCFMENGDELVAGLLVAAVIDIFNSFLKKKIITFVLIFFTQRTRTEQLLL